MRSFVVSFRVLGEPTFGHTFTLLEKFEDGPEAGEGHYAENGGWDGPGHQQRAGDAGQRNHKEHPPATYATIVFRFDDDGMEKTYAEEG